MGYTANLVDAPKGADWDLEMKDIRFNHLALVQRGRAGSEARIGDSAHKWGVAPVIQDNEVKMDMKPIAIGDAVVNVALADADTITKMIADHKQEVADLQTKVGELKAECADANSKVLTDAQIEAKVAERMTVADKAKSLVADMDVAGKNVADIKREAVRGVYGDEAAATEVSDAEINGIFRVMQPAKVDDTARDALKAAKPKLKDGAIDWASIQKKGA